ncbi:hypothetical protein PICMEDRAFT_15765 [Pichia membranifaciens NRRL Y-2026]|uniref:FAD dependent oxidoreductase domain-containing protein n=1 Tax=Pichia membranifaciens NRRL Y-2026 TaxID=763406 RepID=A0A1E3NP68_9ASCO|nr:hypothetical protein PICMEDRAFT_15765 [Pichia membranifaciens NRRL Y-2026]ODQ47890.1 hypothetical protein PICMEDRAFT_15765 [Pichia membranifaciens NRRL Y-2026]
MSKYLPVANSTRSFWLSAEEDDIKGYRSSEELPKEMDTVIIGSGYSGTATAYYLLKGNPSNKSILMFEARNICNGATSRNGGHLKCDLYYGYEGFLRKYGEKDAASIHNFEYDHIRATKALVEEEKIDCNFVITRACDIHFDKSGMDKAISGYNSVSKNSYVNYMHDLQINFGDEAKTISKVEKSPVCLTYTTGHLWPYKLVISLLRICIARGLQVQANTPVLKTKRLNDGRYLVKTPRGDVITKKLIVATNGYTVSVEPGFENKIIPVKGVVSRITSADPSKRTPHLTNTYALRYSSEDYDYLINRGDGSVIVGGGKPVYGDNLDSFYNVVDDSTIIPKTKEFFTNYMKERYYTWKDFDEKLDCIWSGILGLTDDTLPYVGEMLKEKNKFIIAGFHGHGMPRVLLCAKALARVINGESTSLEVPKPFKLTEARMENTENETFASLKTPRKHKL